MKFKDAAYYRQRAIELVAGSLIVLTTTISLMFMLFL